MRMRNVVARGNPQLRYGVKLDTAIQIVKDYFASAKECMMEGEEIHLPGLGKMEIVDMANLVCRDPRTGKEVIYRKRRRVRYKCKTDLLRQLRVK